MVLVLRCSTRSTGSIIFRIHNRLEIMQWKYTRIAWIIEFMQRSWIRYQRKNRSLAPGASIKICSWGPVLSKNLQLTLPDLGYQLGTALSAFTQDHRALTMPTLASYCIHARTMQYCTVRVPYCHIRVPYCQYCTVRVPWLRARNELGRVFSNVVWILAFCATFRPRSGKVRYLQLT